MATNRPLSELRTANNDELLNGFIDTLKENDELTSVLLDRAIVTNQLAIKYNRVTSNAEAVMADCDTALTSSAISGTTVTQNLSTAVKQFDVCTAGVNIGSNPNSVVGTELENAIKAVSRKISEQSLVGDATSNNISGLENQITTTVSQATSGAGNFSLSDLDALYDSVLDRSNLVFIGAPATVRTVTAELRSAAGGLDYQTLAGSDLRVPSYLGIPFLRQENATAGELHLVSLDQYQLWIGETGNDEVAGGVFGVENVGPLEATMKRRMRVYAHIAAALYSTQGAASLQGVA